MRFEDLICNYVNNEYEPRQVGRYWASDIYPIKKGYLKPEDFYQKKEVDKEGVSRIIVGLAMEKQLQEIFEFNKIDVQYQNKYEIKISDEITLVVKPDFEFGDYVLEIKYPFNKVEKIPEKWMYQLEAEHRATNKKVFLGVITIPFYLRVWEYQPSVDRWNEIKFLLTKFHHQLKNKI